MVYLRIRFYRAIKSVDQYFFNKKNVVNIDRAQVLSCIHDMYLDGSGVGFSESSLLTRIHKYKWVRHPDKQLLLAKIKLHIKSLVEGGELNVIRGGQYSVNGKLLTTITMEEKNEREFVAAVKHQRMILFLTLVLVFVGAIQAGIIKLPVLIDFG
ncbi:hypothetical protein GY26_03335 [Gammaproteobacteria bacterium MFB021]|nr:hypothetical protein GY26_03335 [Gammaproteobacteria bacterium MFB021]